MPKNTGVSMGGSMVYASKKRIACDCTKCSRRVKKGKISYCSYYDIFAPEDKRTSCARYDGPMVKKGQPSKKKKNKNKTTK